MATKESKHKSDNLLFEDFLNGKYHLFDYFFDRYYQGLCVYAYKMIQSKTDSEDLVQDFFIRLWERKKTLFLKGNVKSYFLRAVHNRCLDFIAHQQIKEAHRTYQLSHVSSEGMLDYPMLDFELEQRLRIAIEALPEGIRETFLLNRLEGLTYQEIAAKEGVTVKAIEYRISKALTLLRRDLIDYLPLAFLLYPFS